MIDAKWEPGLTHVMRIREKGASEWSFGFETPITGCTFTDLKPTRSTRSRCGPRLPAASVRPPSLRPARPSIAQSRASDD